MPLRDPANEKRALALLSVYRARVKKTTLREAFALCPLGAAEPVPPDIARSRLEGAAGAVELMSTALCLL